jgi:hypothetical protein
MLNERFMPVVSRYKPAMAGAMLITDDVCGFVFIISASDIGVSTTLKPVINPDFDAVVYCKPIVCST